jgi:hypothetical protein
MSSDTPINEKLLTDIGITKPGHRMRLLAKLEMEISGTSKFEKATYSKKILDPMSMLQCVAIPVLVPA